MLRPPGDLGVDSSRAQLLREGLAHSLDQLLALAPLFGDFARKVAVGFRLEKLEAKILELPLDVRHAQAVGKGSVDFPRFQRDSLPFLIPQMLERAHVVQSVRELDQDDPRVLRHREQQLAIVLDLLLGIGPELHAGDLGQSIDHGGDFPTKDITHVFQSGGRILDDIVDQGAREGDRIQMQLGQDGGHLDAVDDVVFAGPTLLPRVGNLAELVGTRDQGQIEPIGVRPELVEQLRWEDLTGKLQRLFLGG